MTAINFPSDPVDEEIFTSGDRSWIWDDTNSTWESASTELLPSQDGEAGKVLKTDGSVLSWTDLTGKSIAMAIVFGG
jgi:hypothetical protein